MPARQLDSRFVARWIDIWDGLIADAEPLLTQLDAAIGDADHGTNMTRAMRACQAALATPSEDSTAAAFSDLGHALAESIGGASGPLYGAIFLALGTSVPAGTGIEAGDLVFGLREALVSLQDMGAAVVGDKTMVDAIAPAITEIELQVSAGAPFEAAVEAAAEAAEAGAASTIPLRARKGRASYLGLRSEGHQDPGATSSALLFEALKRAVIQ
jgi:dihydroxyacetone kinase-like protein